MSIMNEGANRSFRGMSSAYSLYPQKIKNIFTNVRVTGITRVDNNLLVKKALLVGGVVEKDMDHDNHDAEFDPFNLQDILFPGMADFSDENILQGDKSEGDRKIATYWNDLGNDVFDDWGYFFIYAVDQGKYYFPLLNPMNLADGEITEQTFETGFGELTFTIRHGWRERGIFMMDVSCSDSDFEFRFGAYGNFGSDGDENDYDMTATYSDTKTLYYHHHAELGDDEEVLYSYFIPYNDAENATKPYESLYSPEDTDDNSLITKVLTGGVKIFFAKENDVKDWVITEITDGDLNVGNGDIEAEGNITAQGNMICENNLYCDGTILARGMNLGRTNIVYMEDEDYNVPAYLFPNAHFISRPNTDDRYFRMPPSEQLVSAIPNCRPGTSFRFTINNNDNNVEGGYAWNFDFESTDISPVSVKNTTIPPGAIVTYCVVITDGEGPSGYLLQESEPLLIIG